ncbi:MAG TPA: GNAT family N-acetyltransferase [Terriglobales bacterium]|nr:GNAT family N-acetyltransferase [Terriglobales bacterium]
MAQHARFRETDRPQYAPWVAAVYVKPEFRRHGVASKILQETARIAARAPVDGLYIDCHVKTVPVYEKSGWTIFEREVGDKDSVFRSSMSAQGAPPNGGWVGRPGNLGVAGGRPSVS